MSGWVEIEVELWYLSRGKAVKENFRKFKKLIVLSLRGCEKARKVVWNYHHYSDQFGKRRKSLKNKLKLSKAVKLVEQTLSAFFFLHTQKSSAKPKRNEKMTKSALIYIMVIACSEILSSSSLHCHSHCATSTRNKRRKRKESGANENQFEGLKSWIRGKKMGGSRVEKGTEAAEAKKKLALRSYSIANYFIQSFVLFFCSREIRSVVLCCVFYIDKKTGSNVEQIFKWGIYTVLLTERPVRGFVSRVRDVNDKRWTWKNVV